MKVMALKTPPHRNELTLADIADRATITVEEMAEIMNLTRGGAYAAVGRGDVPSIRIGRLYRIPVAQLQRLLSGNGAGTN
jgi:excisionase family DNA binding protein